MPHLGLLHIASFIREFGHDPHILDLQILNWNVDRATNYILEQNPDIIGLTAMTINCFNANKIATTLRQKGYSAPIILGGSHITAVPAETIKRFKAIDYGVIGEGEFTFLDLIEQIDNNQSINKVRGIIRRGKDGTIILNSPRPLIEDLDILPLPAWDLLENFPKKYPSNLQDILIVIFFRARHRIYFCSKNSRENFFLKGFFFTSFTLWKKIPMPCFLEKNFILIVLEIYMKRKLINNISIYSLSRRNFHNFYYSNYFFKK